MRELLSRRSLLACGLVGLLASGSVSVPIPTVSATAGPVPLPAALTRPAAAPRRTAVLDSLGRVPLYFEANVGQTDPQVQFVARSSGHTVFLTPGEAVMVLTRNAKSSEPPAGGREAVPSVEQAVVRMTMEGANRTASPVGLDRQPGVSAYFLGDDPAQWHADVPHYSRVQYGQVYPGVDLVYYGTQGKLEYDFVVAPGADPAQIRLAYRGAEQMHVNARGDLVLNTRIGTLTQRSPRVYQQAGGRQIEVAARYRLVDDTATFDVAAYNRSLPLVIDPVLTYSTYLGGADSDGAFAVAVDASGAAYVAGYTRSTNFPTANAYQESKSADFDVFVTKLAPADGTGAVSLVYSTYLGGGNPDRATAIALDSEGAAYITGYTSSVRFPTVNAYQSSRAGYNEAFVAKLGAYSGSGAVSLAYSTYLGGSESDDEAYGIAVDSEGAAYIAGVTYSSDFPLLRAYQSSLRGGIDAFVAKFGAYSGSGAVSLVYSTLLGAAKTEGARAIAVDTAGAAYVTGYTTSTGFPVLHAYQAGIQGGTDGFLTKINANDGSSDVTLGFSTYLGGSSFDQPYGIALDSSGAVYITGITSSADYPTADAYQPVKGGSYDAFLTKFNAQTGSSALTISYSTYFGGSGNDYAYGIAVDSAGAAYMAGSTASTDLPVLDASQSTFAGGPNDAFIAKLNPHGSGVAGLAYCSYLGGSRSDEASSVAVDSSGAAYLAGWSFSDNFPVANAFQATADDDDDVDSDAFVAKMAMPGARPTFSAAGVVSAASFAAGAVAPGEIVAVYGSNLGPAAGVANSGYDALTGRLPSSLAGVFVSFDGQAAPLYYAGGGQINVQVPYEVAGRAFTNLAVSYGGVVSASVRVPVKAQHPGVFVHQNRAIVTDTLTGAVISPSAPAIKGRYVTVWATGGGIASPAVATGAPASSTTLSYAASTEAWINGSPVEVQFAGLTPGMVGLLQVNIRIPENAASGSSIPLRLSIGGTAAQANIGGAVTVDLAIAIN